MAIATARVSLTIELDLPSEWGAECSLGQIFEQGGSRGSSLSSRQTKGRADRCRPRSSN